MSCLELQRVGSRTDGPWNGESAAADHRIQGIQHRHQRPVLGEDGCGEAARCGTERSAQVLLSAKLVELQQYSGESDWSFENGPRETDQANKCV